MTLDGSGKAELAEHVIAETGAAIDLVYDEARKAGARHTHADVSRARFVDWYCANREWDEPLVRAS